VACRGDTRDAYGVLLQKPEGKRPCERLRQIWNDNIKTDLKEIGWELADWIELAQDRDKWLALVNMVMNLQIP
jgi:hypothetical protein